MKLIISLLIIFFIQDLPFKANEEFDIQLDYKFKPRPVASSTTVNLAESETNRSSSSSLLPYLVLNVKLLKLNNEVRMHVSNNKTSRTINKKISEGDVFEIDMGFTADVKDRVTANEYVLTFSSPAKKETSRIVIHIEQDGTFMVNGEKRGRF